MLSKTRISNRLRQSILDAYREPLIELMKTIITMYQRRPWSSADAKRASLSIQASTVIKLLILGFGLWTDFLKNKES